MQYCRYEIILSLMTTHEGIKTPLFPYVYVVHLPRRTLRYTSSSHCTLVLQQFSFTLPPPHDSLEFASKATRADVIRLGFIVRASESSGFVPALRSTVRSWMQTSESFSSLLFTLGKRTVAQGEANMLLPSIGPLIS